VSQIAMGLNFDMTHGLSGAPVKATDLWENRGGNSA
jgi:hypothetical protein